MRVLLRLLGVELLARVAARLPGRWSAIGTGALLLVVNLLPVWWAHRGVIGMGDVFLVYWCENVVVWFCSTIRIATAQGAGGAGPGMRLTVNGREVVNPDGRALAGFFALHYGIFTVVHGVFTIVMVVILGLKSGLGTIALLVFLIFVSHTVSLVVYWFGRDERLVVSPGQAMAAPYGRMIALHIAVIGGFGIALSSAGGVAGVNEQTAAVALLCGLKTLIDLGLHVRRHLRLGAKVQAEGLYRQPA